MAFFWKSKKKKILSVDVGTSFIKALLTEGPVQDSLKILDYRYVQLAAGAKKITPSELSVILKQAIKGFDFDNESVRAILSTKQNVVRIIELPAGSNEEIKKTVSFQLGRHVPFSHDNTVFDCAPLAEAPTGGGTQKCLLVAARRSEVQAIEHIYEEANIFPLLLNTEPVSVINSYIIFRDKFDEELEINTEKNDCVALVHFGSSHTDLSILSGNIPVACRAVDFGYGKKMWKETVGKGAEENKTEDSAVEEFIVKTTREINTLLKFCQRNFELDAVRIYVSGGPANHLSAADYLKEQSGLETYRFNPFISANLAALKERQENFAKIYSAFVPLASLAARSLTF